jgi:hypothetical protein
MKDVFHKIIFNNHWAADNTLCGRGSTMEATQNLRTELPGFLQRYEITSMIDAPCGDFSWMSTVEFPPGFKYIGGDVVPELINQNKSKYPDVEFVEFDITSGTVPDVDLFFCRDCLIHLKIEDVWKTIDNLARSNVKYVMFTNYMGMDQNYDVVKTGDYRWIDMTLPPYNFPEPIDYIEDSSKTDPRRMALWSLSTIKNLIHETKNQ